MGALCDTLRSLFSSESNLEKALRMKKTATGHNIVPGVFKRAMTEKNINDALMNPNTGQDIKECFVEPMRNFSKLTPYLYLTSLGGVTQENLVNNKITMIINATYEWPIIQNETITSYRVPVEDSDGDNISIYFDEVADKIHQCRQRGGKCIVHCMAGASRSTTLVLAYLMKYEKMSLKSAYNSVRKRRECARPNNGFWEQLIEFEKKIRGKSSVQIITVKHQGIDVRVPDIYKESHKDMYDWVVNKRIADLKEKEKNPNIRTKSQKQFNPIVLKYE